MRSILYNVNSVGVNGTKQCGKSRALIRSAIRISSTTMAIQYIKNDADFSSQIGRNKYLVANFTASWCGPCKAIAPVVDQLYDSGKYDKVEIVRVDLDACPLVASKYVVTSVPTFVFFENGSEVARVVGASAKLLQEIDALNAKAEADTSAGPRSTLSTETPVVGGVSKYVPKGFSVLNLVIDFENAVALNVLPLHESNDDFKNVLRLAEKSGAVMSDADSQALFFVPLHNICKVYSLLVKFTRPTSTEGLELDDDELSEVQAPNLVKIWPNRPGVLSFDDATGDAPHVEKLEDLQDGWYEAKVKYVRFQNVQNLNIFFDGGDEDSHTIVEQLAIVGISGDSKDQGSVLQAEDE